jgi:serine/threonine protein kinase
MWLKNYWDGTQHLFIDSSGTFAEVYLGVDKKSGDQVAIKLIDRKGCKMSVEVIPEINILQLLSHPHIISIKNFMETKFDYAIVLEL